jgi:hypothetical protein
VTSRPSQAVTFLHDLFALGPWYAKVSTGVLHGLLCDLGAVPGPGTMSRRGLNSPLRGTRATARATRARRTDVRPPEYGGVVGASGRALPGLLPGSLPASAPGRPRARPELPRTFFRGAVFPGFRGSPGRADHAEGVPSSFPRLFPGFPPTARPVLPPPPSAGLLPPPPSAPSLCPVLPPAPRERATAPASGVPKHPVGVTRTRSAACSSRVCARRVRPTGVQDRLPGPLGRRGGTP